MSLQYGLLLFPFLPFQVSAAAPEGTAALSLSDMSQLPIDKLELHKQMHVVDTVGKQETSIIHGVGLGKLPHK